MDYLEYKGYKGSVEYSKADNCLFGKVLGMSKDLILYEGNTIDELRADFEAGIVFFGQLFHYRTCNLQYIQYILITAVCYFRGIRLQFQLIHRQLSLFCQPFHLKFGLNGKYPYIYKYILYIQYSQYIFIKKEKFLFAKISLLI